MQNFDLCLCMFELQISLCSSAEKHGSSLILLADRTNGRAIATLLRLSSVVCL